MYNVLKENDEPRKEVNLDTWHKAGYNGLGVNVLVCDFNGKIYDYMKDYAVLIDPEGITKNEGDHNTHVAQVNHEASPRATIYVAPWTHSSKEIIQWLRENPDLIDIAGASLTSPPTDAYNIFKELDIPFTVSSGNDHDKGKNGVNFPANIDEFIAVGAYNWRDKGICRNDVLGYSNGGEDLECLGLTNIYVQNEDRTNTFAYTGTSTARPFLTGMLACYIQWRKEHGLSKLTQKGARDFVITNCVDLHEKGFDYATGFGLFTMPRLEDLEKTLPKPKEPNPPIEVKPIPEKPKEDTKEPEIIIEEPINPPSAPSSPTPEVKNNTFYRVVTGSFESRENVNKRINDLKAKEFDSFTLIAEVNGKQMFRCITGSFNDRRKAEQRISDLKFAGFDSFIAIYKK